MKYFISIFLFIYLLVFGTAEAQIISGSTINNYAINFVKKVLSKEKDIEVVSNRKISNFSAPEGKVTLSISKKTASTIGNHYTVPIKVLINEQVFKTLYVNVKANIYKNIIIANNSIRKNSIISENDIIIERSDITRIRNKSDLFYNKKDLIGMMATSYIPRGKEITSKTIDTPPLVEKSSTIKIIASIGNIEASLFGLALENGRKGDVISIMNPKTKKEFLAKVIANDLATVVF